MRSFPRSALLAFLLAFTLPLFAAIPFPQTESDLKADPTAHFGTLPNGLRYVVRANQEPKNRASLRLLVEAGALNETEDQRGLAHFLEHMAFNGSEHYAPGTLVEFFQRMGMNFGGDTNASTGFNRTLYLLELPDTKEPTLAEGLRVFSDYAGGLLIQPGEIDKERGVVLSEKRTGDSVGFRTLVASYGFAFDGTRFPSRFPIGDAGVISNAKQDAFLDFYHTWYRPELMSVVVVGDIDPAAVEKQIIDTFTPLKAHGAARPVPDLGKITAKEGVKPFYHYESEAASTEVEIATILPYSREPDNAANRLKYLARDLAHDMINRRLSILAKKENAPFSSGSASADEAYNIARLTSISLICKAEQWEAALGVADRELRTALEYGFQPAELKELIARRINGLEQAVKTAATRHSDRIAGSIANSLLEREVFTTPADDLALYKPAYEKLTVADCLAALRQYWSPKHRLISVTGNAKLGDAASAVISAAYDRVSAAPITAPETIADLTWGYSDFGPAGKIAKREHVDDLDITLITFENGVRLNLKKTDFEANRIHISINLGTGALTEPKAQPGLATYTRQTFTAGGLGKYNADDLRRVLAGKTVGAGFGVGAYAFTFGGTTNREDLVLEMQLIAAHITDPGYRPEAARQARKAIDQIYMSFEHTASGPFNLDIAPLLAGGDTRFGLPAKDELLKRNVDEVKAWLGPELAHGAIEVAVVGDLDVEATVAAVAQTLGTLPKRDAKPALDDLRKVKFPATPFSREFSIATEIPKAEIRVYWPSTDGMDIRRNRRLSLLSEVLSDRIRVKVREELGDAYSPGAGSNTSDLYPEYGYFLAGTTVAPDKTKKINDVFVELAADLATKGVTEDELERAKKPLLTGLRESARTNAYWLGSVLSRAQEKPEVLDWSRSRYKDFEGVTAAELSELAKAYLGADRASRVVIVPAAKP